MNGIKRKKESIFNLDIYRIELIIWNQSYW
jgi:hypothetical protein